jgi:hypothetical protein
MSLICEFQVVYRQRAGLAYSEPKTANGILATGADQVRAMFDHPEFVVLAVTPIRPVIDWTKPNFDRDEAAAFLCVKPNTLSIQKGAGDIPYYEYRSGLYPRALLERFLAKQLNPAGQALQKELDQAA